MRGRVLTSSKPRGTLGMEQYFMVSLTKKKLLIGYQIEYIPSVPTLPENFGRGRSGQTVILVQSARTAHLERAHVQLIGAGSVATFAGGPWGYGCT